MIDYTSNPGMVVEPFGTTTDNVEVGTQQVTQTTYAQTIYLADSFEIAFGDDGTPITISIADAAVAGPADAVARLRPTA